jgi:hypothetical protein
MGDGEIRVEYRRMGAGEGRLEERRGDGELTSRARNQGKQS